MSQDIQKPEQQKPAAVFRSFLEKHKGQLAMALPRHLNPDRMSRLALTAFNSNAKLQECNPTSVFGAVVLASQMGLEIGVSGQGYLVPYFDRKKGMICQFIPGWMGIVDLVSRSGRATVWTGAVFEGDEFEYALGSRPFVTHRPMGEDDENKMTHVYACGVVKGMEHMPVIEVWPIRRVTKHRNKFNKVGERHYSYNNWEMYARKIPLLQVCKYMPKSIELTAALTADYAADQGRTITFDGETVIVEGGDDESGETQRQEQGRGTNGLKDALKNKDPKESAGNEQQTAVEHQPTDQADFKGQQQEGQPVERKAEPEKVATGKRPPPPKGNFGGVE